MADQQRAEPLPRQVPGALDGHVSLAAAGTAPDRQPAAALEPAEQVDLRVGQRLDLGVLGLDLAAQRVRQPGRPGEQLHETADDRRAVQEQVRTEGVPEHLAHPLRQTPQVLAADYEFGDRLLGDRLGGPVAVREDDRVAQADGFRVVAEEFPQATPQVVLAVGGLLEGVLDVVRVPAGVGGEPLLARPVEGHPAALEFRHQDAVGRVGQDEVRLAVPQPPAVPTASEPGDVVEHGPARRKLPVEQVVEAHLGPVPRVSPAGLGHELRVEAGLSRHRQTSRRIVSP